MTKTAWQATRLPKFAPLKRNAEFDVVVVGGGITGLSAAFFLKQAGKKVCVVERNRLTSGDTGCTTAHLTYVTDSRLSELVKKFGDRATRLFWLAGETAINAIEAISANHAIDCEFQRIPGFLHAAWHGKKDETATLEAEANKARELGFDAQFVPRAPLANRPAIRLSNQAKFHPLKYLAGLAKLVDGDGCRIVEETEVTGVEDDPLVVKCGKLAIECDDVIVATHVPLMGKSGLASATILQAKLYPYSSYAVRAKAPAGSLPVASFWDTSNPYYYLRVDRAPKFDYVIFGGADHKTGQAGNENDAFEDVVKTLHEIVPSAVVDCRWSAQVIETNDGLPYIGTTTEHQFIATGFAGNGITLGTTAGIMARDAVLGRANPWSELFAPQRTKAFGGTWRALKESIDYPFYYLKDRVAPAEGTSTRDLKPGEGKILRLGGERVAASRDSDGKVLQVSPYCTHMGCLVHWNQAEKTWDCPCHGSRFKPDGSVQAGPAEAPLDRIRKQAAVRKPAGKPKKPAPRKVSPSSKARR
ncbi:MAG TPA: FAD-dependent oxidoreductase [Pirellulales bacterium]|jgi:glycine/D-amino acid oxidase-like deaminating enzyme/nitrite reductase/ring-hydroxylating ferredoxin subunit|nr:FAD-dependent oxidoreductase [Pirellulales bacterium]